LKEKHFLPQRTEFSRSTGAEKNSISAAIFGCFPYNAVNTSIIKTVPLLAISRAGTRPENRWEWGNWRAKGNLQKIRKLHAVTGFC
jgi:hypothetical protein